MMKQQGIKSRVCSLIQQDAMALWKVEGDCFMSGLLSVDLTLRPACRMVAA